MTTTHTYSFQVDSDIVKDTYQNKDNYLIEYSVDVPKEYCVIYFTSHDLYYPNTEDAFRKRLVSKNHFEWYKTRVKHAHKHIFIRDVQKQFYLEGINAKLNTSQKLFSFLKEETTGYKVITIGSSAGGLASIVYGQLLNAEKIYSFNGTFEIQTKLNYSNETVNPIIFRNRENKELTHWFDTRNFITKPSSIYYFQSNKSTYDLNQFAHIKDLSINRIQFINSRHGIPFLKSNLPKVLNLPSEDLEKLKDQIFYPVSFSIKMEGTIRTALALIALVTNKIKKS